MVYPKSAVHGTQTLAELDKKLKPGESPQNYIECPFCAGRGAEAVVKAVPKDKRKHLATTFEGGRAIDLGKALKYNHDHFGVKVKGSTNFRSFVKMKVHMRECFLMAHGREIQETDLPPLYQAVRRSSPKAKRQKRSSLFTGSDAEDEDDGEEPITLGPMGAGTCREFLRQNLERDSRKGSAKRAV
jgi:hypothetical protein